VGIADPDEAHLNLEGFVRVSNNSGEEYEEAQVRLVVGRINLVEKIAELAHIPVADVTKLGDLEKAGLRTRAVRRALGESKGAFGGGRGERDGVEAPKEVAKEGLGE